MFEASRIISAACAICLYFFGILGAPVNNRKRDTTCFTWLLILMILVLTSEAAVSIVQTLQDEKTPELEPLTATVLSILAFVLQVTDLCRGESEEEDTPAWHTYLWSWIIMAVSDILVIVGLTCSPRSSRFDLKNSVFPTALRFSLDLALIAAFAWPDREGSIRLSDENGNKTAGGDIGSGRRSKDRSLPALQRSVAHEIQTAGGLWPWVKRFRIFLPWVWPRDVPWSKECVAGTLVIRYAGAYIGLHIPHLTSAFVDSIAQAHSDRDFHLIWKPLSRMAAANLAHSSCTMDFLQGLIWTHFEVSRDMNVRLSIFREILSNGETIFGVNDAADVSESMKMGIKVCHAIDNIVLSTMPHIYTLIRVSIYLCSLYSPQVALVQGAVVAIHLLLLSHSRRAQAFIRDKERVADQKAERKRVDAFQNWRTLASNGQIDTEVNTFETILKEKAGLIMKRLYLKFKHALASLLTNTLGEFAATALVVLYGFQISGDIGAAVTFRSYWMLQQGSLQSLMLVPWNILDALSDADRLRRLLDSNPSMTYGTKELNQVTGSIKFQDVTFGYQTENPVFRNFDLSIQAGEITVIFGPPGVGKSTLGFLLSRAKDPQGGAIMLDGHDIRDLKKGVLSKLVAVTEQAARILRGSFSYNIKYPRPEATDEEMVKAAELSGIGEIISELPKGYNTLIGEGGRSLSGGETQRVALARVILSGTPVIVLDEFTSAQDANSAAHIMKGIATEYAGETVIFIGHDLSMALHAKHIIVLKKGLTGSEIDEQGSHEELLRKGGAYTKLWGSYNTHSDMQKDTLVEEKVKAANPDCTNP